MVEVEKHVLDLDSLRYTRELVWLAPSQLHFFFFFSVNQYSYSHYLVYDEISMYWSARGDTG